MKKMFLVFTAVICFFSIKNVFALEYVANDGKTYQVSSPETLRDYFYFTNIYNQDLTSPNFSVYYNHNNERDYCIFFRQGSEPVSISSSYYGYRNGCSASYLGVDSLTCYDSTDNFNEVTPSANFQSNRLFLTAYDLLFYSNKVVNCNDSSVLDPNFSYEFIESNYSSSSDDSSSSISKEEFLTIPILLSVLICINFLRVCFPGKGGKNL